MTLIIAEAWVNHNGSLETAKKLIEVESKLEEKTNLKKPKKQNPRKKSSSTKIDIVEVNENETNNQPKKKGWWNN